MSDARVERVGVVVHGGRDAALVAAGEIVTWLRARGVHTRALEDEAVDADEHCDAASFAAGADLVISVGGDGTLLRAAQLAGPADVPLLGVKVGRLGFLTEVEPAGAFELLAEILGGSMRIEERAAVLAEPIAAPWSEPQWALNEVMVEKRARHRVIALRTWVGDEEVTTFSGDGVIVATPTGSTAYSFSARGPIVSPRVDCLLLTPVAPHMVFDRAIVLGPDERVVLEVEGDEPGLLSVDGQESLDLPLGSRVRIRKAERAAKLVRSARSPSFLALLREKFSLPPTTA